MALDLSKYRTKDKGDNKPVYIEEEKSPTFLEGVESVGKSTLDYYADVQADLAKQKEEEKKFISDLYKAKGANYITELGFGLLKKTGDRLATPINPLVERLVENSSEDTQAGLKTIGDTLDSFNKFIGAQAMIKTDYAAAGLGESFISTIGGGAATKALDGLTGLTSKISLKPKSNKELTKQLENTVELDNDYLDKKYSKKTSIADELNAYVGYKDILKDIKDTVETKNGITAFTDNTEKLLRERGYDTVADFLNENIDNINYSNSTRDKATILDNFKDFDDGLIKTSMEDLIEGGYVKYKRNIEGNDIYEYTARSSNIGKIKGDEVAIPDRFNFKSLKELSDGEKLIKLADTGNNIIRDINREIDRLGKDGYSGNDLISRLSKVDEEYNLGIGDDISKAYDSVTGEISPNKIKDIIDKINKKKYLVNEKVLEKDIRSFGINPSKFIEKKLASAEIKGINLAKAEYNAKKVELELKYKDDKLKLIEEKKKAVAERNNKIKEIRDNIKANEKIKKDIYKYITDNFKSKNFYGSTNIMKYINKGFLNLKSVDDLKSMTGKIVNQVFIEHKRGLIKNIVREIKSLRKVGDINDYTRKKIDGALISEVRKVLEGLNIKELNDLPIGYLEGLNNKILDFKDFAKTQGKINIENEKKLNKEIEGKILDELGDKRIDLFGDEKYGADEKFLDLVKDGKFGNILIRGFKRFNNLSLFAKQAIEIMSGGSKTFKEVFISIPLKAYNRYKTELNLVQGKILEIAKLIKTPENSYRLGFFQLSKRVDGNNLEGLEKLLETITDKKGNIKKEYLSAKRYDNPPSYLKGINDSQLNDLWDKLSNTKVAEYIYYVMGNKDLMSAGKIADGIYSELGDKLYKVALEVDGVLLDRKTNYGLTLMRTSGNDLSSDFSINKEFTTPKISDNFLHSSVKTDGGTYELNLLNNLSQHTAKVLYYTNMRKAFKTIKTMREDLVKTGKMGGLAYERLGDYIDRLALGNIPLKSGFERGIFNFNSYMSATLTSFKLSTISVQPLGLIDGAGLIGVENVLWGSRALSSNKLRDLMYSRSAILRDRNGGYEFLDELKRFEGISMTEAYRTLIEKGNKGVAMMDRIVASNIWLAAYRKRILEIKPDITDNEILLLNNKEALSYADVEMTGVMASTDWIFSSPLQETVYTKTMFSLMGPLINRYGAWVSQMAIKSRGGINPIFNIATSLWWPAANIAEYGIRYGLAKLYYTVGLSGYDPDDKELSDIVSDIILGEIGATPLGVFTKGLENPDFAAPVIFSPLYKITNGIKDLLEESDDKKIDGIKSILSIPAGDFAKLLELLKD